ncbi:MAG: hypothetical protein J6M16_11385 [Clostridia bacterium]|nr:hypothetical protein [Clostridia bacterium]
METNVKPKENENAYSDGYMESCLLGTMVLNPKLMGIYCEKLELDDFTSDSNKLIFHFLKEYSIWHGNDITESKINSFFLEMKRKSPVYSIFGERDFYSTTIKYYLSLGTLNAPWDNNFYLGVKKLSLLRKISRLDLSPESIKNTEGFEDLSSSDILNKLLCKLQSLEKEAETEKSELLSEDLGAKLMSLLYNPPVGLNTPFSFINENMQGLCDNTVTFLGGLSNSGKSRLLVYLLTHLVVDSGVKVCLISNEMSKEDFYRIFLTTVLNLPALIKRHGVKASVTQKKLIKGDFTGKDGALLRPRENEDEHSFTLRALNENKELSTLYDILVFFRDYYEDCFYFVNLSSDYSPEKLSAVIKNMKQKGCRVFAYDTLKGYKSSEWQDLTQTATAFSELIKGDSDKIIGIATFQLTDATQLYSPEDLSSMNIATAKHIMHVCDNMLMFMRIKREDFGGYEIDNGVKPKNIDSSNYTDKSLVAVKIIKNRSGGGKDTIYALTADYNSNTWAENGIILPKR